MCTVGYCISKQAPYSDWTADETRPKRRPELAIIYEGHDSDRSLFVISFSLGYHNMAEKYQDILSFLEQSSSSSTSESDERVMARSLTINCRSPHGFSSRFRH
jgi:hypothetical protein